MEIGKAEFPLDSAWQYSDAVNIISLLEDTPVLILKIRPYFIKGKIYSARMSSWGFFDNANESPEEEHLRNFQESRRFLDFWSKGPQKYFWYYFSLIVGPTRDVII